MNRRKLFAGALAAPVALALPKAEALASTQFQPGDVLAVQRYDVIELASQGAIFMRKVPAYFERMMTEKLLYSVERGAVARGGKVVGTPQIEREWMLARSGAWVDGEWLPPIPAHWVYKVSADVAVPA